MENELEARVTKKINDLKAVLQNVDSQLKAIFAYLAKPGKSSYVRKTDTIDHGSLSGLADDDHPQYLLLAGRTGGQIAKGGTGSGDDLTLQTTSHVTKGSYIFSEMTVAGFLKNNASGVVTGGNALPAISLEIFTDTDVLDAANEIAICNKGVAMTLTLPAATGSAKLFYIKNVGVGVATIEGDGAETIDGAANYALNQWDAITVVDYAAGVWAIL